MYHAKKIGIFISHIFGEFQRNLCQGIIDKATEFGYIVEIFSSTDGEDVGSYGLGESSILRIPNYDEFSGICFASGTYLLPSLRERIAQTLAEKCTCPIIEVTQKNAAFPAVVLDNDKAAAQLTEHFIAEHHHKRICYLGNCLESDFSEKRFQYYQSVMEKHGLSVSESDYYICDYSYEAITAAVDHFLKPGTKPDSVICYNDRMAVSLMEALYKRGFRIPEDIAVAGFDDLEIGRNITPSLSTVTFPIYEMGQAAMSLLLDAFKKKPLPDRTVITAGPLYRTSCGCTKNKGTLPTLYENRLLERAYALENAMLNNIKMSTTLYHIRDLDEGMELLEKFLSRIENCHEFYICLYQNWDAIPPHIREIASVQEEYKDMDILTMPFAYRDGRILPSCSFTKKHTLPDYIYADSQSAYIYSPLYFENQEFGYVALSYRDNVLSYPFNFFSWIVNVSRMLRNICESRQSDLMINRLEDIYMKDDLTGLYNRQGFYRLTAPLLEQAKKDNASLLAMVFRMDALKTINDTFGHLEGDFAIQVLGHALKHSCTDKMLLARMGGDHFFALAANRNEDDAKEITAAISRYLENYNKLHTKKYNIGFSCGHVLKDAKNITAIQDLFETAYFSCIP